MTSNRDKRPIEQARIERGLSQSEVARRAGISRQALSAIEAGAYQPNVGVALRLARVLNQSVERLFSADDAVEHLDALWAGADRPPEPSARSHVVLARVNGKLVAIPQRAAAIRLAPAAGRLERVENGRAEVTAIRSREEIESTLLIAGCDPAVTLLADWLARHRAQANVVAVPCGSGSALAELAAGRVHAAGVHLRDPKSGEYNLASIRDVMRNQRLLVFNFARWELGLATAQENPLSIRNFADFVSNRVRIVNRERGSGARAALDEALRHMGVAPTQVNGYEREVGGHLEVANAIASGEADTGVTIRVAADAYGLGFIPIREERYDLVLAEDESDSEPMRTLLTAINSRRFATELRELCAYDVSETGTLIARLN